jgi:hypothetical protein
MKPIRTIISISFVLVAFSMLAQNPKKAIKNSLIPESFTIVYDINLNDSLAPENMQNIPNIGLNEVVLSRIFNSEVSPYEYSFDENKITDTLTINEAKEKLGGGIEEVNIEDIETGVIVTRNISRSISIAEITKYRFLEEWNLDEKNFKFTKKIIAYSPIRQYYRDEDYDQLNPFYRIAFTIFNDKRGQLKQAKADKWTLIKKAIYEVPFDKKPWGNDSIGRAISYKLSEAGYTLLENENCPFLNSVTRRNIALLLYKAAMDKNTIAYDFNGYYRKKEDINNSLDIREMEIEPNSESEYQSTIKIWSEFLPEEIKALLFFEDWYINESTLQFDKRITAIAPIRYYHKYDDVEYERKSIPFVLYTNQEDKDRLEKLYYKLISDGYNSMIIQHIEMFYLLGNQSKSPDFKAFCVEKQKDLLAFVLKNELLPEERLQLYLLSEKIKLGFTSDKFDNLALGDLHSIFNILKTYTDTCTNNGALIQYYKCSKMLGEKIVQLEDNCENRLNLLKLYKKLGLKDEISKWHNTDKIWLTQCLANYYINSADADDNKLGILLYNKLFQDTLNCKIISIYLDVPKESRPKNLDIDKFIETQNETELACLGEFLDFKYRSSIDSLEILEYAKSTEKIYLKLIEHNAISGYFIGFYKAEIALNKPLDFTLLNQLTDPKDVLPLLNYFFDGVSNNQNVPSKYLQYCKPLVEKLVKTDISEDELWIFANSIISIKKWGNDDVGKIYSTYLEIIFNKLMAIDPNSFYYLFIRYELDMEQGKNPGIDNLLNQKNIDNLEAFARYFGSGFYEYIFGEYRSEYGSYLENYLVNATKFYEKLIVLQPKNDEFKHEYSEVYYKLCYHYLTKNQNSKALESASKINKIESSNDDGVIATIFCYLLGNQAAKAYKMTDDYKLKQRASKVSYWEFFKYETQSLLYYIKDNPELKKYLEYLKK